MISHRTLLTEKKKVSIKINEFSANEPHQSHCTHLEHKGLQRFIIIACGRKSGFHFHHNCGVPDKTFLEISVREGGKLPNYEKLINCFVCFKTQKSMKITGGKIINHCLSVTEKKN